MTAKGKIYTLFPNEKKTLFIMTIQRKGYTFQKLLV